MQSQGIEAIVFDLGGVLLEWNPRYLYRPHFERTEQMEEFLTEIDFAGWNARQDQGRPFEEAVADLSSRFPHRADLIRLYHERWEESVIGPIAGSVQILRTLKARGYPIYGLTNWSAETFPIARRKYDFLQLFDAIVVSGEVHLLKPDPRIFQLVAEKAGCSPSKCLLIDDNEENIATAARLGFKTLQFRSTVQLEARLVALGLLPPRGTEMPRR